MSLERVSLVLKTICQVKIMPQQDPCKGFYDDGVVAVAAAVLGPAQFSLPEVVCADGSLTNHDRFVFL